MAADAQPPRRVAPHLPPSIDEALLPEAAALPPDVPRSQPRATRVSDAERDEVVGRLREAAVEGCLELDELDERITAAYRAATAAELGALTDDLPPVPAGPRRRATRWTVGVLGSERRTGPWRPDTPTRALAVFGSCVVDLRDIDHDGGEVVIHASAVCGSVDVVVPEGACVELAGFAVLGSKRSRARPGSDPTLTATVRARAVLGSVTVRHAERPVP